MIDIWFLVATVEVFAIIALMTISQHLERQSTMWKKAWTSALRKVDELERADRERRVKERQAIDPTFPDNPYYVDYSGGARKTKIEHDMRQPRDPSQ